jgi:2-polyprenyl-3-methyl-5-hydroxy-6-metoxy-1,4-benzoquinol methylase
MVEETRHKYEYQVDVEADTAPARVVRMVGENKRVLEIGAGPGSITKVLHGESCCRVTALEIDSEAIKKLRPFCERVFQADLNNPAWSDLVNQTDRFDVVVAADVLEHVYEPLAVLKAMKGFLNESGYIVISLPHVGHCALHACLLEEDFEYRDWGLLDRTHIRFFGIKNIQKLFEDAGLKIVHAEFVVRNPDQTEFAERWARTSEDFRRVLATNPFGLVYQVVVKAVPASYEGAAISLCDLPVAQISKGVTATLIPFFSVREKLKQLVRYIVPLKVRGYLRRLASRFGVTL